MASNKKKNKGDDEKYNKVANILRAAGISGLGERPPIDAVLHVLQNLGVLLYGEDPLVAAVCRDAVISTFRLGNYVTAPAKLVDAALKSTPKKEDEGEYTTYGMTENGSVIIDIVQRGRKLEWVVVRPGSGKIKLVGEEPYHPADKVTGKMMWPRHTLQWAIPCAKEVEKAIDLGARSPFEELVFLFKRRAVLPEPQGPYADLLAAWVLGTYRLDEFSYFPELLLEGPPERGKTRIGNACMFTAFRGMATPSVTPAVIFRQRARHRIGLFLDVTNLPDKLYRSNDIEDLAAGLTSANRRFSYASINSTAMG